MREQVTGIQSTKTKDSPKETVSAPTNKLTFYLSPSGDRKLDLNDETGLAKIIEDSSGPKRKVDYFIKVNAGNIAYNPFDKSYPTNSVALGKRMGKASYSFKAVTRRAFDLYTSFLKTRQQKCLQEAQGAIDAK